jgi:hypothetical protein
VNLVHRLLKNTVTADTGIRAYLLLTEAAVNGLGVDPDAEGMVVQGEVVPDFGEITVKVKDMQPVYEAASRVGRTFYAPEDVLMTLVTEVPLPIEHVWNYANQSEIRNVITGSDSYEVMDRKNDRVGAGSTYQCYHGNMIVTQLVMEWLPFERVVLQQMAPIPGRRPTQSILDLRFTEIEEGTRLSLTVTKPTGPLLQRTLGRIMMTTRRDRTQADMDEFGDRIVEDYAANHPAAMDTQVALSSSHIDAAVYDSLKSQNDLHT